MTTPTRNALVEALDYVTGKPLRDLTAVELAERLEYAAAPPTMKVAHLNREAARRLRTMEAGASKGVTHA